MSRYNELQELLHNIKNYKDLAGIVLLGSFSANQGDDTSDIDIEFVHYDKNYVPVELPPNNWEWDIGECTIDDYSCLSRSDGMNFAYVTAEVLLDRTGEIRKKIEEFIRPGFEYFRNDLGNILDSYYNGYYRSMKSLRRNNLFGANTMACHSMMLLNTILYNVNGLLHTYINRLPAIIHKLEILPLPAYELMEHMTNIAVKADADSQIKVYLSVKKMMNGLGYTDVYDAWEGKLDREILYRANASGIDKELTK